MDLDLLHFIRVLAPGMMLGSALGRELPLTRGPRDFARVLQARRRGAYVSCSNVCIRGDCSFGVRALVRNDTIIIDSSVGRSTAIGPYSLLGGASIGPFTSISWRVTIGAGNHPLKHATTHNFPEVEAYGVATPTGMHRAPPQVTLGADVWVGCHAVILSGTDVADGAAIAAGAVVNRHVRPYEIVGGVPVRTLGWRFPPHIAARLQALAWWGWPDELLSENLQLFSAPLDELVLTRLEDVAADLLLKPNARPSRDPRSP